MSTFQVTQGHFTETAVKQQNEVYKVCIKQIIKSLQNIRDSKFKKVKWKFRLILRLALQDRSKPKMAPIT